MKGNKRKIKERSKGGRKRDYQVNWSTWKEESNIVHHFSNAVLTLKAVDALWLILPIAI